MADGIKQKLKELEECDESIVQVPATLDDLLRRRTALQREVDNLRWLASPLRRVPPEILELIFIEFLKENDHRRIRRLLLVCRHWYTIITTRESFWCKIKVQLLDLVAPVKISDWKPYVEACLAHSGAMPLQVEIDYDQDLDPGHSIGHEEMEIYVLENFGMFAYPIRLLVGQEGLHMRRWRSLIFSISDSISRTIADVFSEILVWPTPLLEELDVRGIDHFLHLTFPNLANLHTLKFHFTSLKLRAFNVSSSSLQILHMPYLTKRSSFEALSKFINLRELCFTTAWFVYHFDDDGEPPKMTFPNLIKLQLPGLVPDDLLVSFFDLPRLKFLTVGGTKSLFEASQADFAPQIVELTLDLKHNVWYEDFQESEQHFVPFRSLKSLHASQDMKEDIIQKLMRLRCSQGAEVLPNLLRLVLRDGNARRYTVVNLSNENTYSEHSYDDYREVKSGLEEA